MGHVRSGVAPSGSTHRGDHRETISVILRIHDPEGITRLERAVQCLHAQEDTRVQPIVVTQRFPAEDVAMVEARVRRQWFFDDLPQPRVLNFEDGSSGDARSALMNLGLHEHLALGNRYVAFLDHDDLVYSHAYRVLVDRLRTSGAAVAFASVEVADVVPLHDYEFIYAMSNPYRGHDKLDLVRNNFCPLHSYLVDTDRVDHDLLYFNEELVRVEDYDFLLRVAGQNACDFKAIGTKIGIYFRRADGSNSTPLGTGPVTEREPGTEWKDSREILERLRATYPINFYASDF